MKPSGVTTNHNVIERWIKQRGGEPAKIIGAGSAAVEDGDILTVLFDQVEQEGALPCTWDEFFELFDSHSLQFTYGEEPQDFSFEPAGSSEV